MNNMIIDIGLLRYILNSKNQIISICLIMRFHEQHDYKYWTNKIYFQFKIQNNVNIFNNAVP